MAELSILTYPDERLKQPCEPVETFDETLAALVQSLIDTMLAGPGSVGVAAPQVGRLLRVAVVDVSSRKKAKSHGRLVLVNPEIQDWDGMAVGREGCMSVPNYTGNVIRAERVALRAQDVSGATYTVEAEGFEARALQHEIDHLDGLLFLDRLVSRRGDLFRRKTFKVPPRC